MSEHELWNELGNLYFMSGSYKQAAYAYNRSIHMDAGFGRPYCNLALTYVKQGRYEEAVDLYQRSIELLADQTEKAITWYRLGDVYRHLKNYRDAIMAYQQADVLGPELSQESKESDQILYGGSGENLPATSPEMQARALETEAAVQAAEAQAEAPAGASTDDLTTAVTETEVIQPASLIASVTSTSLPGDAALNETQMELPPVPEEPAASIIALLEVFEPEMPEVETIGEIETPEPEMEAPEPVEIFEPEADLQAEPIETEPVSESVEAEPIGEPDGSVEIHEPEAAPEPAVLEEEITSEEAGPLQESPRATIEIVYDTDEPAPFEPEEETPDPQVMEVRTETLSVPELTEVATETLAVIKEPAPAAETLSNAADPAAGWIDDDYLENFDHETEVYVPEAEVDQWSDWLPLEPEPAWSPPENSWSGEEGAQMEVEVAVQAPALTARRLPGHMLRESWEPALPLADDRLELPLESETPAEEFIVPQEAPEPFVEPEDEAALHRNAAPDPLQTTEELAIIEREITRFRCVVQGNPKNAVAWDTLGTYYKSAQRYREAILAYQQAVVVDPTRAPYHHRLGIMYSIVGRDEDAMKAFQDALEIDPNHSLANAGLGGYYRKMGLEELAQKHIGRAMKNLYNSENEYNKACFEALCGNIEQSIELLKIALKNKQTYVDWVLRDPDLDSIRRDPRFKQLIADYMA